MHLKRAKEANKQAKHKEHFSDTGTQPVQLKSITFLSLYKYSANLKIMSI
jgi:hypothetical protein